MPLPAVAIVGRPNVGKSALFNCLAGRRISIVEPTAGVTRDRVSTIIAHGGRSFELVDTGGMGVHDVDNLTADIERQIRHAIDEAAVVLFVVDIRVGITPLDEEVAARLRAVGKPVLCLANKCDVNELEAQASEFYRLGCNDVLPVSAMHYRGRRDLLDRIVRLLPEGADQEPGEVVLKLAIVGRRNTGKSTFINSLAQADRMIVSEVPGTTRDSVDVRFERDGKVYLAIDTAGVRRKGSLASDIEFYSLVRAERSIRRADVVLHFHDPRFRVSKVDKQLAEYILAQYKPAIFVVNKWDLVKSELKTGEFADYLQRVFPNLDFVPFAFITAKSGRNVQKLLNLAQALHKQASARVGTGELNRIVQEALARNQPPVRFNRQPQIYFATQSGTHPPTIVLFTNGPDLFDETYLRYLLKTFRDELPFKEVPIKLILRGRHGTPTEGGDEEVPVEVEAFEMSEDQLEKPPEKKPGHKKKAPRQPQLWKDI